MEGPRYFLKIAVVRRSIVVVRGGSTVLQSLAVVRRSTAVVRRGAPLYFVSSVALQFVFLYEYV